MLNVAYTYNAGTNNGQMYQMCSWRIVSVALAAWLSAQGMACGSQPAGYLRQLRFSADGSYALAQDETEVFVLTVHPLAVLFRIPAGNATDAQFTPDSRQIVFISATTRADPREIKLAPRKPRVERWSITRAARSSSVDLGGTPCDSERLSPDGKVLACVDFAGTLRVSDVTSGRVMLEKHRFGEQFKEIVSKVVFSGGTSNDPAEHVDHIWRKVRGDAGSAEFDFSPDARYLASFPEDNIHGALLIDLAKSAPVRLRRKLGLLKLGWGRELNSSERGQFFAFISPATMVVSNPFWTKHDVTTVSLIQVPSGKLLSKPRLPPGPVFAAADPGFVIVRPFGHTGSYDNPPRAAAVELMTGQVIVSQTPALDVLGGYYIAQPAPDVVGLYERGKGIQASLVLHQK
ncbi:MAG TPA: hypothetical protein VMI94_11525 [Bryobacteraceae bacterium]|nr:hypothetical protein [Bryobacteraceae bacterium]